MNLAHKYEKEISYSITALQMCLEDAMKHYPKSDVNVKILKAKNSLLELRETLRNYEISEVDPYGPCYRV